MRSRQAKSHWPTVILLLIILSSAYLGYTKLRMPKDPPTTLTLPGAPAFPTTTETLIRARLDTTHKQEKDRPPYTNRLILESSPYLKQHQHNPINWYPWGDRAFADAKARQVPVLLSVGYATCHWCHVMAHESFEDVEIATYLNQNYVAIKVDREERPDVDSHYMTIVQLMTGQGGWPMTVWLTPDRIPFYGGTYFPARDGDRGPYIGFLTLLKDLKKAYDTDPQKISAIGKNLDTALTEFHHLTQGKQLLSAKENQQLISPFIKAADKTFGGISGAPKFPSSLPLQLLMPWQDHKWDRLVQTTLDNMAYGGIYDQISGGFHRYSVDETWFIPHYEKMLYDNALLTLTYTDAFQRFKNSEYQRIVSETLAFVDAEMTSPQGYFYAAIDADSETETGKKEEGHYYTFTSQDFKQSLGEQFSQSLALYFKLRQQEKEAIPLRRTGPVSDFAKANNLDAFAFQDEVDRALQLLKTMRNKRERPITDRKLITAWNGLMIAAYAKAGFVFNNRHWIKQAERAAHFILDNLERHGQLYRIYHENEHKQPAFLDDYAMLIHGLITLHQSTQNPYWLAEAIRLDKRLTAFADDTDGLYYRSRVDGAESGLKNDKPISDAALPAENAIIIRNLLRLYHLTLDKHYINRATKALTSLSPTMKKRPTSMAESLLATYELHAKGKEIVIVIPADQGDKGKKFLNPLRNTYLPGAVFLINDSKTAMPAASTPLLDGKVAIDNKITAYICKDGVCQQPLTDLIEFKIQVAKP